MAFDVVTPASLARGVIPLTNDIVYTVPILTRTIVKTIDIINTTTNSITVTVTLGTTILVSSVVIKRDGYYQWTGAQVLNAGDTISAIASATGTTLHISGGECA